VDKDNRPIEPLNKDMFLEKKISIDPDNIPSQKLEESVTTKEISK
jgi:hypothetical protein